MSKHRLLFYGTKQSDTEETFIECYTNQLEEVSIWIEEDGKPPTVICLDISTAIKFAKTVRTKINEAKKSEVTNG